MNETIIKTLEQDVTSIHNQPMGPVEEGDQAIVDTVQNVPIGNHVVSKGDYGQTKLSKWVAPANAIRISTFEDQKSTSTGKYKGDGSSVIVSSDGIEAELKHRDENGNTARNYSGGKAAFSVGYGDKSIVSGHLPGERETVQAKKKLAAERIARAQQHLGKQTVEYASRA